MTQAALKSEAFQRAALTSESYRSTGLLCLLGALAIFVILRGIASGDVLVVVLQFVFLALVITHELFMLRAIRRAIRDGSEIHRDKWVLNVLLESQIPTVAVLLLLGAPWFTPYQALVAPAVLIYFLLIILSTLRLSPTLSVLTGLLSAFGYLFVTFYTALRFQNPEVRSDALPMTVYYIYAGLILTGASSLLLSLVAFAPTSRRRSEKLN